MRDADFLVNEFDRVHCCKGREESLMRSQRMPRTSRPKTASDCGGSGTHLGSTTDSRRSLGRSNCCAAFVRKSPSPRSISRPTSARPQRWPCGSSRAHWVLHCHADSSTSSIVAQSSIRQPRSPSSASHHARHQGPIASRASRNVHEHCLGAAFTREDALLRWRSFRACRRDCRTMTALQVRPHVL